MKSNKKSSSLQQIVAAIEMLYGGKLDCAITLAAAGEGMLPSTDDPHLRKQLQPYHRELDLNLVANWLKHETGPDEVQFEEFEAVIMITRAITKFVVVHHQSCQPFEDFFGWARNAGYPVPSSAPNSK